MATRVVLSSSSLLSNITKRKAARAQAAAAKKSAASKAVKPPTNAASQPAQAKTNNSSNPTSNPAPEPSISSVSPPPLVQTLKAQPLITPAYWDEAKIALSKKSIVLRKLIPKFGDAKLESRGDAFITLVRSVVGQQLSVKAAQTIWLRVLQQMGGTTPEHLLAQTPEQLRACGLSERKVRYVCNIAQNFQQNPHLPQQLEQMSDVEVVQRLTQIQGIGVWTAEMFLIFHMLRPNVTPIDDLGLLKAISVNYFSGEPTSRAEAREICASWEPWGTVGTWYMWRSLDPQVVTY